MKKVILLFAFSFLIFPQLLRSQSIEDVSCQFLQAIKANDSTRYLSFFPQPGDAHIVISDMLRRRGVELEDQSIETGSDSLEYTSAETKSALSTLVSYIGRKRDSLALAGVDWTRANCDSLTFEITRSPASSFATAKGKIVFMPGVKGGTFVISHAVRFGQSWRIFHAAFE